jgi:hypothetical protein
MLEAERAPKEALLQEELRLASTTKESMPALYKLDPRCVDKAAAGPSVSR